MIVDFHTHIFPEKIAAKAVNKLAKLACAVPYTDGTERALLDSMRAAGVNYSVTLPVVTAPEQVTKINDGVIAAREEKLCAGLISFGGIHPDYPDLKREMRRLREGGVRGIKLHPAYQGCDLNAPNMLRLIGYASEYGLIVVVHAGLDIATIEHNYASISMIEQVMTEIRPPKFVLAHMGAWAEWELVEHALAGAPLWLDTSFSIGPTVPCPGSTPRPGQDAMLADDDFIRLCRKHGTDRVLFATDSPWRDQTDYVCRIEAMPFTRAERDAIFGENARILLESDL